VTAHKEHKRQAMAQVRAVEEILRRWDPIGIGNDEISPADEYDSYAPHIVSLVVQGCSIRELAQHLEDVRVETLGVSADPSRDRVTAQEIVHALRVRSA
jgi:hypothetical protein